MESSFGYTWHRRAYRAEFFTQILKNRAAALPTTLVIICTRLQSRIQHFLKFLVVQATSRVFGRDPDQDLDRHRFSIAQGGLELPLAERGARRFIHLWQDALIHFNILRNPVVSQCALENDHFVDLFWRYCQ